MCLHAACTLPARLVCDVPAASIVPSLEGESGRERGAPLGLVGPRDAPCKAPLKPAIVLGEKSHPSSHIPPAGLVTVPRQWWYRARTWQEHRGHERLGTGGRLCPGCAGSACLLWLPRKVAEPQGSASSGSAWGYGSKAEGQKPGQKLWGAWLHPSEGASSLNLGYALHTSFHQHMDMQPWL